MLRDLDLVGAGAVFHAEAGSLTPVHDLLRRAWDLDALAEEYEAFVAAFAGRRPVDRRRTVRRRSSRLVHAWRRFPFVDPEIPERLLPHRWPGRRAKQTFDARHADWVAGRERVVRLVRADERASDGPDSGLIRVDVDGR